MKRYRSPDGEERLWFADDEIEHVIEDELRKANLLPTTSEPVTDLERFVESHLRSPFDQYAGLPSEVLGITEFRRGQPPAISINRNLTGSALDEDDSPPGILGRWRATVAHEATHVVLHRILFEFDEHQGELFAAPPTTEPQLMRCLKRDVGYSARGGDWREIQANKGMAALLMPARLFKRVTRQETSDLGIPSTALTPGAPATSVLVRRLAGRFSVSRQAAEIRLRTTGFIKPSGTQILEPS
jgi:hypothetical protein